MKDIRDFYIKFPQHPNYQSNQIIVDDVIQVIVNKIEMILFTNQGDFIGDISLGSNLSTYLWNTNVSADYIQNVIQEQFNQYIPELVNYNTTLNVQLMEGTLADILVVNITINDVNVQAIFS
jgi:hypothetical protein